MPGYMMSKKITNKRVPKAVERYKDVQQKYNKNKYHGWTDQWDREFNGHSKQQSPFTSDSKSNNKRKKGYEDDGFVVDDEVSVSSESYEDQDSSSDYCDEEVEDKQEDDDSSSDYCDEEEFEDDEDSDDPEYIPNNRIAYKKQNKPEPKKTKRLPPRRCRKYNICV